MAVRSVVVAAGGALALTALTLIPIGEVAAAPFTVTNANASGAGSLAQALIDAAGNAEADVITFDPATNGVTIPGGANINNDDVTLDGNGVGVTIIAGTVNVNSGGSGVTANAVVSDLTAETIAAHRVSAEGQAGMRAFMEKRRAPWLPDGE